MDDGELGTLTKLAKENVVLRARLDEVYELLDGTIGEEDDCTISRNELRAVLGEDYVE